MPSKTEKPTSTVYVSTSDNIWIKGLVGLYVILIALTVVLVTYCAYIFQIVDFGAALMPCCGRIKEI